MKCPKCGYNSFEYLDSCKKCNTDLISFKMTHGIKPTILPAMDLVVGRSTEEQRPLLASSPGSGALPESEEFSWHESAEEAAGEAGAFPALGLDLPPEEPDHFNFSLDLPEPEAEPAPAAGGEELSLGGFGDEENDFFASSDAASAPQAGKDEPTAREDTPFGELSFEDVYNVEDSNDTSPAPAEEALPDFFTPDEVGGPTSAADDDTLDGLLEIDRNVDGQVATVFQETTGEEDAEPFLTQEAAQEESADDADLMGLSPEEYESLFGEAPSKKKKPAPEPE